MPTPQPLPDIELSSQSLFDYILGSLEPEDEDRIAVIDVADGTETTYGQLRNFALSVAGGLSHRGVKKGDVVALHCPNSVAFLVASQALWRLGACITTVSLLAPREAIASQLRDSGATMLLTVAALGDDAVEAGRDAGLSDDAIIQLDSSRGLHLMLAERRTPPEVEVSSDDLAALPYSSGTTALPKGVMLTHGNLVHNVQQAQAFPLVTREDTVFGVLPFFHIYGLTAIACLSLAQRCRLVTVPRFDLGSFLSTHEKYQVTFTFIAPPIAVLLAKHPLVAEADLSSMRALFSGAASLDDDLARAVEQRLSIHVQQGYGMTETSPLAFANIDPEAPRGSIGVLPPNSEARIVDIDTLEPIDIPDAATAAANEEHPGFGRVGELWYRGPQVMQGYLNKPEETAIALTEDGWLRTGDMAVYDVDGYVYVVDRLKELIKYKGYQVPPAELEAVLLTNPDVADAAVVGAVREGEEIPVAFVVPTGAAGEAVARGELSDADAQALAQSIMSFVAERVASYKKVRDVRFIPQIPKSATGKILRRELRPLV